MNNKKQSYLLTQISVKLLTIILLSKNISSSESVWTTDYNCEDKKYCVEPSNWYKILGLEKCNPKTSKQQSPRDIVSSENNETREQSFTTNLPNNSNPLNQKMLGNIFNNGHTIEFAFKEHHLRILSENEGSDEGPFLKAGCDSIDDKLLCKQHLLQAHFHWDNRNSHNFDNPCQYDSGSEHSLDQQFQPLDMHLVHLDKIRDKYAVISIFFCVKDNRANKKSYNEEMQKFSSQLDSSIPKIIGHERLLNIYNINRELIQSEEDGQNRSNVHQKQTYNTEIDFNPYKVWQTTNDEEINFVHYYGSFTSPACLEGVMWLIKEEPVLIEKDIMDKFYSIRFEENKTEVQNQRPLDDLTNESPLQYIKWLNYQNKTQETTYDNYVTKVIYNELESKAKKLELGIWIFGILSLLLFLFIIILFIKQVYKRESSHSKEEEYFNN